jgi:hypothetical protein
MDALDAWALWTLGGCGRLEAVDAWRLGGWKEKGVGMDERHRVKKPVPNTQYPVTNDQ